MNNSIFQLALIFLLSPLYLFILCSYVIFSFFFNVIILIILILIIFIIFIRCYFLLWLNNPEDVSSVLISLYFFICAVILTRIFTSRLMLAFSLNIFFPLVLHLWDISLVRLLLEELHIISLLFILIFFFLVITVTIIIVWSFMPFRFSIITWIFSRIRLFSF